MYNIGYVQLVGMLISYYLEIHRRRVTRILIDVHESYIISCVTFHVYITIKSIHIGTCACTGILSIIRHKCILFL